MRTFDPDRAAMALIDAQMMGDKKAADKWHVTPRTLTNWRKRLSEDSIFAVYFQKKKEIWEKEWAKSIPPVIHSALEFLLEAFAEADRTDPQVIQAVNKSLSTLVEVEITKQVIDLRLQQYGDR